MSPRPIARAHAAIAPKRSALLLCLCFALLFAQPTRTQEAPATLKFFKNYFVTGGHVAHGVDLAPQSGGNGLVQGTIPFSGVPANADILVALLYWETITDAASGFEPTGAKFRGHDIADVPGTVADESVTKEIGSLSLTPNYAPCWSSGGGSGATYTMKAYRADVLRFLPVPGVDPVTGTGTPTGKRIVNDSDLTAHGFGPHTVLLPDAGTGNQVPSTAGATLLVIYREAGASLKGIVIYDGLHVQAEAETTTLNLRGFYQASRGASSFARLTPFVGNGAPNATDILSFNGQDIATNAFVGDQSPASDRGWDSPTFDVSGLTSLAAPDGAYGEKFSMSLRHSSTTPADCLALVGTVVATNVPDGDKDGLLDIWESSGTALSDPNDDALPLLSAMGASPTRKDVFLEVGFMTTGPATYGPLTNGVCIAPACVEDTNGHSHLPAYEAIKLFGDTLKNAPVDPLPNGQFRGIRLHVDVGSNYQTNGLVEGGVTYNPVTDGYVIPSAGGLAHGGESLEETACTPGVDDPCRFPYNRGTTGWKTGFQAVRDQPLRLITIDVNGDVVSDVTLPDGDQVPDEQECLTAEQDGSPLTTCQRRFDRIRRSIFRYGLYGHALGFRKFQIDDPLTPYNDTLIPVTNSGIGDYPGGDFYVSLGAFDDFTGTPFMQASTTAHEMGHTFWRRHGGDVAEPNCKPNYQSVMNYQHQIRGVTTAAGDTIIDFSRQILPGLNEGMLVESQGLAGANASWAYRARWYSPTSYFDQAVQASPATRHCDGTPLGLNEVGLYRVEGTTVSSPTGNDWNADLDWNDTVSQDVSFNGAISVLNAGSNDWLTIDLQQVGSRRNIGSVTGLGASFGTKLSLDMGDGDIGDGDIGDGDIGDGDIGDGDIGDGDIGDGDIGDGDIGVGQEINLETAIGIGSSPTGLRAFSRKDHIELRWNAPHVSKAPPAGAVVKYDLYRVRATAFTAANFSNATPPLTSILADGNVNDLPDPNTMYLDFDVRNNQDYTYGVVAEFEDGSRSGFSNFRTIRKRP